MHNIIVTSPSFMVSHDNSSCTTESLYTVHSGGLGMSVEHLWSLSS